MPDLSPAPTSAPAGAPALTLNPVLLDQLPLGLAWLDAQGCLVFGNRRFVAMTGFAGGCVAQASAPVQQLLGWHPPRPWPPAVSRTGPRTGTGLRAAASAGTWPPVGDGAPVFETRSWVEDTSGASLWLASRLYRLDDAPPGRTLPRTAAGEAVALCVIEDMTVAEERDLARMQLGTLVDSAGVGLATFRQGGPNAGPTARPNEAAPAADGGARRAVAQPAPRSASSSAGLAPPLGVSGGGSASLQGIRRDTVRPESLAEYDRLQQALRQGTRAQVQYAIAHPEHGLRWLMTTVEPGQLASGQRTTSVVTQDITEQQLAKERSERLLHEVTTILQHSPAGIAFLRDDVFVRSNERLDRMLGLQPGQFIGRRFEDVLSALPQGAEVVRQARETLQVQPVFETELAIPWQGQTFWYALTVRRLDAPGPIQATSEAIAVLIDVTRFKRQRLALESAARDRELMFNLSDVGIAFVKDGHVQRANPALVDLLGYEESVLNQLDLSRLQARDVASDPWWNLSGDWGGEYPVQKADGGVLWLQITQRAVEPGKPEAGLIMSFVNVDDRHRIEQMLAVQVERNRVILDSVFVGIVTVGDKGIEWMNRSARRMLGGNLADFFGRPMSVVATSAIDHPLRDTAYLDDLAEGQAHTFECPLHALDGREFWAVGKAVVTLNTRGQRQVTYALLDIDSRRRAESLLEETQSTLQRALEMAPLAIVMLDARSLKVVQINQMAAALAGQPAAALIGKTPEEYFPGAHVERVRGDMEQALTENALVQREYGWQLHGIERIWDVRYLPLAKPGAPPDQLLVVATDMTEQRAAERARLTAAIAQREILVREVHHRIKNNLQGVAGLLQQIAVRKPEVASALSEVVGQVQAIAQVYGLQVGAGGLLRLRDVVKAITASVQRTFGHDITLAEPGNDDPVWILPEAESIPIALCINELLTNAIKHGQANGASVRCEVCCTDESVRVDIVNAGRLSPDFDLARLPRGISGLGLVRSLLPKRSASLTIVQEGECVRSRIELQPPGVTRQAPLSAQEPAPGQQIALWPPAA